MAKFTRWDRVGDQLATWHRFAVDAGHEPDRVLTWARENLRGAWTYRHLNDAEVHREFACPPAGRFFLKVRTAEGSDVKRLQLRFGAADRGRS